MKEALALIAIILLWMFVASQSVVWAYNVADSDSNQLLAPVYTHIDWLASSNNMELLFDASKNISQRMNAYTAWDYVFLRLAEIRNYINWSLVKLAQSSQDSTKETRTKHETMTSSMSSSEQPPESILFALSHLFSN